MFEKRSLFLFTILWINGGSLCEGYCVEMPACNLTAYSSGLQVVADDCARSCAAVKSDLDFRPHIIRYDYSTILDGSCWCLDERGDEAIGPCSAVRPGMNLDDAQCPQNIKYDATAVYRYELVYNNTDDAVQAGQSISYSATPTPTTDALNASGLLPSSLYDTYFPSKDGQPMPVFSTSSQVFSEVMFHTLGSKAVVVVSSQVSPLDWPRCMSDQLCVANSKEVEVKPLSRTVLECDPAILEDTFATCTLSIIGVNAVFHTLEFEGVGGQRTLPPMHSQVYNLNFRGILSSTTGSQVASVSYPSTKLHVAYDVRVTSRGIVSSVQTVLRTSGIVELVHLRPSCPGTSYYCYKSDNCTESALECAAILRQAQANAVECGMGVTFGLTDRLCMSDSDEIVLQDLSSGSLASSLWVVDVVILDLSSYATDLLIDINMNHTWEVYPGDYIGLQERTGAFSYTQSTISRGRSYNSPISKGDTISFGSFDDSLRRHYFTNIFVQKYAQIIIKEELHGCFRIPVVYTLYDADVNATDVTTITEIVYVQEEVMQVAIDAEETGITNGSFTASVLGHFGCNHTYSWDFGDGTDVVETTDASVEHVYTMEGIYNIALIARNNVSLDNDSVSVTIYDAVKDLNVNYTEAIESTDSFNLEISISQGMWVTYDIFWGDGADSSIRWDDVGNNIDIGFVASHTVWANHSYALGVYEVTVVASNLLSRVDHNFTVYIQESIVDLSFEPRSPIRFGDPVLCNFSYSFGTHLFSAALLDGNHSVGLDLRYQSGYTEILLSDYQTTGPHQVVLTLSNRLNTLSASLDLIVDYPIFGAGFFNTMAAIPAVNITDENGTIISTSSSTSIAAVPQVSYEFGFMVGNASRTTFLIDYGDGDTVNEFFSDDLIDSRQNYSHTYAVAGIYNLYMVLNNSQAEAPEERVEVISEYPIKDVHFAAVPLADSWTVSEANGFSAQVSFQLTIDSGIGVGTGASWLIDYGDEHSDPYDDTAYLSRSGSPGVDGRDLLKSFTHSYTQGGRITATITLINRVSVIVLTVNLDIYEEFYNFSLPQMSFDNAGDGSLVPGNANDQGVSIFPLYADITFAAVMPYGSHESWTWDFGDGTYFSQNGSDGETAVHRYSTVGVYSLNVSVYNLPFSASLTWKVGVQMAVENVSIVSPAASTSPKNYTAHFDINLGTVGTDPCFKVDFGDDAADPSRWLYLSSLGIHCQNYFGGNLEGPLQTIDVDALQLAGESWEAVVKYSLILHSIGQYQIKVTGKNDVGKDEYLYKFGVTRGPCYFPKISFQEHNSCTQPAMCEPSGLFKHHYRSVELEVKADVIINCSTPLSGYEWDIYKVNETTGVLADYSSSLPVSFNLSDFQQTLQLPAHTLEYGLYTIFLNVTMTNETGISDRVSMQIRIMPTPLVAVFYRDDYRVVGEGRPLEIDASESKDPDFLGVGVDSELTFTWLCRRYCEAEFTWTGDASLYDRNLQNENNTCGNYTSNNYGCFHDDEYNSSGIFTQSREGKIIQFTNATYVFESIFVTVVVQKGSRIAYAEQEVAIAQGDPPDISMFCLSNCKKKFNVGWIYSAGITIRNKLPRRYLYDWTLLRQSKHKLNESYWLHGATPGIKFSSFALAANTIRKQDVDSSFYIQVKSLATGNTADNFGMTRHLITPNFPPEPRPGVSCTVTPGNGTVMDTWFKFGCDGDPFVDETNDAPFSYRILTSSSPDSNFKTFLQGSTYVFNMEFRLPNGLEENGYQVYFKLEVEDRWKAPAQLAAGSVVVRPRPRIEGSTVDDSVEIANDLLADITSTAESGDVDGTLNVISSCAEVLNLAKGPVVIPGEECSKCKKNVARMEVRGNLMKVVRSSMSAGKPTREQLRVSLQTTAGILSAPDEVDVATLDTAVYCSQLSLERMIENQDDVSFEQIREEALLLINALGKHLEAEKYHILSGMLRSENLASQGDVLGGTARKRRAIEGAQGGYDEEMVARSNEAIGMTETIGSLVSDKLVPGQGKAVIGSSKFALTLEKQLIEDFQEIPATPAEGGISFGQNLEEITGGSNDSEAQVSSKIAILTSPFVSKNRTREGNMTVNSKVLTLSISNGSTAYQPGPLATPVILTVPNEEVTAETRINASAPVGADFVNVFQITVELNSSLHLSVNQTEPPANSSANYTAPEDVIGFVMFIRIGKAPDLTLQEYDWVCVLPGNISEDISHLVNATNRAQTSYTSISPTGLPINATAVGLDGMTCMISNSVLNSTEASVTVYVGISYIAANQTQLAPSRSSRRRRRRSTVADATAVVEPIAESAPVWFELTYYSAQCKIWNPYEFSWTTEGCEVGPATSSAGTQCMCTILTVKPPDSGKTISEVVGSVPEGISFGAGFTIPMNVFDPHNSAFNNLAENPLIFSVMVSLMCLYMCCLIWAAKQDRNDSLKAGASPLLDNDPVDSYLYELTFHTSSRGRAGTTAKVSMVMSGDDDETPPRLIYDDKRPVLKRGSIDSFILSTSRCLGSLTHLRIWHDNSGKSPGWLFNYLVVVDLQTRQKFFFICGRWLAVDEEDALIDRVVPVASKEDMTDFGHLFWTKTRQDFTDGHIWFSVLGRPHKSIFTRCQRLTCCITFLFSTMATNILLYNTEEAVPAGQLYRIGPISFTLPMLVKGVTSSLMMFPVNILIIMMFRRTKLRGANKPKVVPRPVISTIEEPSSYNHPATMRSAGNTQSTRASRMSVRPKRASKKKRKQECKLWLPWWFLFFPYVLCLCVSGVSFWVCVEVGGVLGPDVSAEWMVSFCTSFFESLLLSQPLKVVGFALFYALVIKSPTIDEDLDTDPGLRDGEEYMHKQQVASPHSKYTSDFMSKQKSLARFKAMPVPPEQEYIQAAQAKRRKEAQMQSVLREIFAYLIFLYLLFMVTYGSKDPNAYRFYSHFQNIYQHGSNHRYGAQLEGEKWTSTIPVPMSKVTTGPMFFQWFDRTFVPGLYGMLKYNGANGDLFSSDEANFIVGAPRIRQVRMTSADCLMPVYALEHTCTDFYDSQADDQESYKDGWVDRGNDSAAAMPEAFRYRTSDELDGYAYLGKLGFYSGGGYATELGATAAAARTKAAYLQKNAWLDDKTRAVFVEFVLYNVNLNIFSTSFILFEALPTGAIYPKFDIKMLKLDRYRGSMALAVLISELLTVCYTLYFLFREVKLFRKEGMAYFHNFWNMVELVTLLLLLTSISLFFVRLGISLNTWAKFNADQNAYTSFSRAAWFEELYLYILGVLIYLANIKFLKILRFNKRMRLLGLTLKAVWIPLVSFLMALGITFIGFAQMSYIVFHNDLLSFSSFGATCGTLFSLMLNKFDYGSMQEANAFFAPLIFISFTMMIGFVLLNFMLSLILDGFASVQATLNQQENKYEILDFMASKFKSFLGFQTVRMPDMFSNSKDQYLDGTDKELDFKVAQLTDRLQDYVISDPDDMRLMRDAEKSILQKKKAKGMGKPIFSTF